MCPNALGVRATRPVTTVIYEGINLLYMMLVRMFVLNLAVEMQKRLWFFMRVYWVFILSEALLPIKQRKVLPVDLSR